MNDEENRLTAKGLLKLGKDYFVAYTILVKDSPGFTDLIYVKYYLFCHSMELVLKAYLRHHGESYREILGYKHDIEKLIFKVCSNGGLCFDENLKERMLVLNRYYKAKQFEYSKTGYKELVDIGKLETNLSGLIAQVEDIVFCRSI